MRWGKVREVTSDGRPGPTHLYTPNPNQLLAHLAKDWSSSQGRLGYVSETTPTVMTQQHESLFLALTKPVVSQGDSPGPLLAQLSWLLPFYSTSMSSCPSTVGPGWGKELEGLKLVIRCSRLEGTCVASAHSPLARTRHMTLPSDKGCKEYKPSRCPEREENSAY